MKNIWLMAQITFKEGIRNRILLGIFFFAFALCVGNLIITNMFAYDLGKVAIDVGLSIVSIAGLIIIFFMGINLLAKDLDKRTIYMVLSRPISRRQYIIGKFCGLGLLILTSVLILGLFAAGSVKLAMWNAPIISRPILPGPPLCSRWFFSCFHCSLPCRWLFCSLARPPVLFWP